MIFPLFNSTLILTLIRTEFSNTDKEISAYIVPYSGVHSGGVAVCERRIEAVSGFTGSAGTVIITKDKALLWTDGRYFLQAENQIDNNWTLMKQGEPGVLSESQWLVQNLKPGSCIGVDGSHYSKSKWDSVTTALSASNIFLIDIKVNLVDLFWQYKPKCPSNPVYIHPIEFSGKSIVDKLAEVRNNMKQRNANLLLVSELDDNAWLMNLRGSDLLPVFYSFAIVASDTTYLLVKPNVTSDEVKKILNSSNVQIIENYFEADQFLHELMNKTEINRIWLSKNVNARMGNMASELAEKSVLMTVSPIALLRAKKNAVEVNGMKSANLKDSAAVVAFLSWLQQKISKETVGNIDEISAAAKLFEFRNLAARDGYFIHNSFDTISAFGSNAAIIHYTPTRETVKNISTENLYLLDSGGHYLDGTTDITRTIHLGHATAEIKDRFTRVLKGHIAVATAKFPKKSPAIQLDSFARQYLWEIGLDYKHGSGHGIGHFLSNEAPVGFTNSYSEDDTGFDEDMTVSNEPGYYKDNEYGIRIENAVRVKKSSACYSFLEMETISYVPIQLNLILPSMLTQKEVNWLNNYHKDCKFKLERYYNNVDYFEDIDVILKWLYDSTLPLLQESSKTDNYSTVILTA